MKTILWAQNEDTMMKDTFVIDGVVIEESANSEVEKAFAELSAAGQSLKIAPSDVEIFAANNIMSKSTNFSVENDTYYIQGSFEEKDNNGRNMAYMFLTYECDSFDEMLARLKFSTDLLNRHYIGKDLDSLSKIVNLDSHLIHNLAYKINKKKVTTKILILVIFIIVAVVLWKLMSSGPK